MNKKFILSLAAVGLLCILLTAAGRWWVRRNQVPVSPVSAASDREMTVQELSPFKNIDIHVQSADIRFETGDSFAVRYRLHEKEEVRQAEVIGDTFVFSTSFDPQWGPDLGGWELIVTLPENTPLRQAVLYSAAGSIQMESLSFSGGTLITKAGALSLKNIVCDTLELETVSEEIILSGSEISSLSANNVASSIRIDGIFGRTDVYSVSGDCTFAGTIREEGAFETVSGKIDVQTAARSVAAQSIGGITVDGREQGIQYDSGDGTPSLSLKSVSGKIYLNAPSSAA